MAEIGKPERIVEDEPLAWPDVEPAFLPQEPALPWPAPTPSPETEPVPEPASAPAPA